MNAYELKFKVQQTKNDSKFFSRDNMKFAGDTMKNYGVRSTTIDSYTDLNIDCWELYRKKPVKYGLQSSAYFCKQTFRQVFKKD